MGTYFTLEMYKELSIFPGSPEFYFSVGCLTHPRVVYQRFPAWLSGKPDET